ncbi:MAG TPA: hypothetical protein VMV40_04760, partial [Acidiferrobacter sp.]|nr:hypothetical protein [Acidiferrobacter sp.]
MIVLCGRWRRSLTYRMTRSMTFLAAAGRGSGKRFDIRRFFAQCSPGSPFGTVYYPFPARPGAPRMTVARFC